MTFNKNHANWQNFLKVYSKHICHFKEKEKDRQRHRAEGRPGGGGGNDMGRGSRNMMNIGDSNMGNMGGGGGGNLMTTVLGGGGGGMMGAAGMMNAAVNNMMSSSNMMGNFNLGDNLGIQLLAQLGIDPSTITNQVFVANVSIFLKLCVRSRIKLFS